MCDKNSMSTNIIVRLRLVGEYAEGSIFLLSFFAPEYTRKSGKYGNIKLPKFFLIIWEKTFLYKILFCLIRQRSFQYNLLLKTWSNDQASELFLKVFLGEQRTFQHTFKGMKAPLHLLEHGQEITMIVEPIKSHFFSYCTKKKKKKKVLKVDELPSPNI